MTEQDIKYGLAGVVVDTTAISKVMPATNSLTYRGYAVQDLATQCCFEEVAHLLLIGELPNAQKLSDFQAEEHENRGISNALKTVIQSFRPDAHPMDLVRTAVSYLGQEQDLNQYTNDAKTLAMAKKLYACLPTIVAAVARVRHGKSIIEPHPSLGYSENVFHMFFGTVPEPEIIKCFDISMTLYAEHSFNASTFTARTITSSISDIYSATTGAIGSLKGPLHGGANEAVMEAMLQVKTPEKAQEWMENALANKRKIMGFGHRVYTNGDSRVPTMRDAFFKMCEIKGESRWMDIYKIWDKTMVAAKGIHPNLDLPAGPAYYLMGFDIPMFTPLFVMARTTGWSAHIAEQQADNKLIRPLSAYTGYDKRDVTDLSSRP